jgi:hypothetical protein
MEPLRISCSLCRSDRVRLVASTDQLLAVPAMHVRHSSPSSSQRQTHRSSARDRRFNNYILPVSVSCASERLRLPCRWHGGEPETGPQPAPDRASTAPSFDRGPGQGSWALQSRPPAWPVQWCPGHLIGELVTSRVDGAFTCSGRLGAIVAGTSNAASARTFSRIRN